MQSGDLRAACVPVGRAGAVRVSDDSMRGARAQISEAREFKTPTFRAQREKWATRKFKGQATRPSVSVELLPDDLLAGQDPQMQKALDLARAF